MINTNELRKGNLVYAQDCGISEVLEVYKDSVKLIDGDIWHESSIDPIPLTEEWLIKLGFEKDDNGVEQFDQDYCEWYTREFPIIGYLTQSSDKEYLFDDQSDTLRIKYLHKLENLIFELTEEELAIK